jgi:hypothetical protein
MQTREQKKSAALLLFPNPKKHEGRKCLQLWYGSLNLGFQGLRRFGSGLVFGFGLGLGCRNCKYIGKLLSLYPVPLK